MCLRPEINEKCCTVRKAESVTGVPKATINKYVNITVTALGGKESISNETDLDLAVLSTCVLPPHGKLIFSPSQEDFFGPFYTTYGRSWVSMDEAADSVLLN